MAGTTTTGQILFEMWIFFYATIVMPLSEGKLKGIMTQMTTNVVTHVIGNDTGRAVTVTANFKNGEKN